MHEIAHERLAGSAFGLRDFIFVMNRNVIQFARMDVDGLAQVFHRHRRALDMPSGIAAAPRTVPLHQMGGLIKHPQGEIVLAALVRGVLQPLLGKLIFEALPRQPAHPVGPRAISRRRNRLRCRQRRPYPRFKMRAIRAIMSRMYSVARQNWPGGIGFSIRNIFHFSG